MRLDTLRLSLKIFIPNLKCVLRIKSDMQFTQDVDSDASTRRNALPFRHAVMDINHYNQQLYQDRTLEFIQAESSHRLKAKGLNVVIAMDQIRNVVDSVAEANPRIGTLETVEMAVAYLVAYVYNEMTINQTTRPYDKSVLKYDGSFGIRSLSSGEIGLKKKRLNQIGRMF